MRIRPLIALVALAAACEASIPTYSLQVGEPVEVTLRRGEAAEFGSDPLRVTFTNVAEDSRCPSDVVCIWEGNGKATLVLALGTFEQSYDLNTTGPATVSVGGYRVQLLQLSPYPVSTSPIPQNSYRVKLRVESVPPPPN